MVLDLLALIHGARADLPGSVKAATCRGSRLQPIGEEHHLYAAVAGVVAVRHFVDDGLRHHLAENLILHQRASTGLQCIPLPFQLHIISMQWHCYYPCIQEMNLALPYQVGVLWAESFAYITVFTG